MLEKTGRIGLILALGVLFFGALPSLAVDAAALAPVYRQFLADVALLMSKAEKKAFLALEKDYQRDAYVKAFWQARDPYPETPRNEFEIEWRRRLEEVKTRFAGPLDDRARIYQLHGEPESVFETSCALAINPLEIWRYPQNRGRAGSLVLIFYRTPAPGTYTIWQPYEGYEALAPGLLMAASQTDDEFRHLIFRRCSVEHANIIMSAVAAVRAEQEVGILDAVQGPAERPGDIEWLESFKVVSTDLATDTVPLSARVERVEFLPARRNHARLRALIAVPRAEATIADVAGQSSYEFLVTGELLLAGELADSFRIRFALPPAAPGDPTPDLPLLVEREVRPGSYDLVLKVEEIGTRKAFRDARAIEVPASALADSAASIPAGEEAAGADLAGDGGAETERPIIRIVPPAGGLQASAVRFETEVDPRVKKVTFSLGDKPLLTKGRPPFSIELNLGSLPTGQTVKAVAYDGAGAVLGSDELLLNPGAQRFAVRLLAPRSGATRGGTVAAEAEIKVPDGESLDRLELFVDDARVATLYQAPWRQPLGLPTDGAIVSVRAVAYLADGRSAEDLVVLNAPGEVGRVDVRLVELPVDVRDGSGHAVPDLALGDFSVVEDGVAQTLARVDRVEKLPIRAVLLLDTSASMVDALPEVKQAAGGFLRAAIGEGDRAALLHFREKAVVDVAFTPDTVALAGGLAGLKAEGATALYDSLVFALDYMKGLSGPRALLLLTDGGDRSSRFSFDQAVEAARRSGVVVYAIGLALPRGDLAARRELEKLAAATGGLALFPRGADELTGLYAAIDRDLRARYLLSYQSTNTSNDGNFRAVEVKLGRQDLEIRAPAGYAP